MSGCAKRSTGSLPSRLPGWALVAAWPLTVPSNLPWPGGHGVGVALQRLDLCVWGIVAGQALRALLAGALAQGGAQLLRAFELRHGLGRIHLGAGHAGALGGAGAGAEQQADAAQ